MKKKEKRSLAYRLAKTIDMDSLSSISGGTQGAGIQWSSHETLKASGGSLQTVDVAIDVGIDI